MDPNQHRNALNKNDMLHWYEIKSILGQGGFGITYLAEDTNLSRLFAIKEYLPAEFSVRDAANTVQPISEKHADVFNWGKKRFLDEARTLAQFEHPNIIRVHSFFENNNTGYMVMEYEEGIDLSDLIKAGEFSTKIVCLVLLFRSWKASIWFTKRVLSTAT
jgi:serine/threonine protein kinase